MTASQDLLSVAICGPQETPYQNSLYLFDVKLPDRYPSIPPEVYFNTYGAGCLNPNLYPTGRVCLSLLGTWKGTKPGEKWNEESNLLQLVLSIQCMLQFNIIRLEIAELLLF